MEEQQPITRDKLGVRVVCVSDTHGRHADIKVPDGDILIHAGDFTHFGKKKDVIAVNEWLGTLPHKHKIVVNGNHEKNAEWKKDTAKLLSNCRLLPWETKDICCYILVEQSQMENKLYYYEWCCISFNDHLLPTSYRFILLVSSLRILW